MGVPSMSVLSKEYVKSRIRAYADGQIDDPTSDTVEMAFTAIDADPVSGDWKAATWETALTSSGPVYYARCLVGPGGTVQLAGGLYTVWVRINGATEVPVMQSGRIFIDDATP